MAVKLSNMTAQRLLIVLQRIDQNDAVKLPGLVRLDIARNINRLIPNVTAFERVLMQKQRERVAGSHNAALEQEMDELGDATAEYELYEIEPTQLKLDDNTRITGDMIAALAPVLKEFYTAKAA